MARRCTSGTDDSFGLVHVWSVEKKKRKTGQSENERVLF